MKFKKILFSILFIILIYPISVFASDGETKDLYMNIDIKEDGSIFVQELATLEGSYNGRLREVFYKNSSVGHFTGTDSDFAGSDIYNGSGIENLKVYSVSGRNLSFSDLFNTSKRSEAFDEVSYGTNGDSKKYEKNYKSDGYSLRIYNPSSNNSSFYMEYTIKDAVVVHDDVAELAWNLIGTGYTDNIDNMQAKVNLPGVDSDIRVWLHGPLNGEIKRLEGKIAQVDYNFVGANNPVSVRVMFNKDLVPTATKFSNVDGKTKILKYEEKQAKIANEQRNKIKRKLMIVKAITVIWYIILTISLIIFIIKKKQNDKCEFDMEYLRDFPANYGPEVLDYLINKSLTDNTLGASILMLMEKKVIACEPIENDKKNYILKKISNDESNLTESEKALLDLMFNLVGTGEEVTLKEIKKYGSTESRARKFLSSYNKWKKAATNQGKTEKFFVTNNPAKTLPIILCVIGFLITIINAGEETGFVLGYMAVVVGIIILIIVGSTKFRTKEGTLQYKKWMALKKFLEDFSTFDDKDLPEVPLWGKYLVYATVLGCANKLRKTMEVKLQNMDESVYSNYYYYHYYFNDDFSHSINNAIPSAVSSSNSSIAAASSSSGGGFGGGSSGGGGSFGGGGGGGHF